MSRGPARRSRELSDDQVVASRPATAQAWADRINFAFDDTITAVFEVGRRLIAAKDALGRGGWQSMWTVECPVKFKLRMAQMYMRAASHSELSKTQHVALLPRSIGALYELTTLPPEVLSKALADGVIHPNMERQAARRLRPYQPPPYPADGKTGYSTVIGPGPQRTVFLPGDGTCHEVDEPAAGAARIESEWADSQDRPLPLAFKFSLETIQHVAEIIQTLTDEETLRDFAGNDEIAEDLAMAAQNFFLALDLAWKRTHAVNGVYCGVKVSGEGLLGFAQPGVAVLESEPA